MTMHRIQMVCGEKDSKCCRAVCVCMCVWDLPEVAVRVVVLGVVQVLCWEQACFFALLLLLSHAPGPKHTNTALRVNSRNLCTWQSCPLVKNCLFLSQSLDSKRAITPKKGYGAKANGLCVKINTAVMQHSKSDSAGLHDINGLDSAKKAVFLWLCKWGLCLRSHRCLQRKRAPQRLCRWLTWFSVVSRDYKVVSWLKHFFSKKRKTPNASLNELLQVSKEGEERRRDQEYDHELSLVRCFQTETYISSSG